MEDVKPEWFAGRLRELRTAAGLSREELATKAGLKVGGIRDLEQGLNGPTWATMVAICAALGVDCTAFTVPPAEREPAGPGRPPKVEEPPTQPPTQKMTKPRGRPRKDAGGEG